MYVEGCRIVLCLFLFFFKQKTAYEMRISDWSSDVCSSDLGPVEGEAIAVKIDKLADLDKHKGQVRGKVGFLDELREYKPGDEADFKRHDGTTLEDLQAFTVPKDRGSDPAKRAQEYLERQELTRARNQFMVDEGALATVSISSRDNGIVRTGAGGSRKAGEPVGVPEFAMIAEHYNQVMRALDDKETVRLRLHADSRFTTAYDRDGHNTHPEITGRDRKSGG